MIYPRMINLRQSTALAQSTQKKRPAYIKVHKAFLGDEFMPPLSYLLRLLPSVGGRLGCLPIAPFRRPKQ
jgi:hypothetical protein